MAPLLHLEVLLLPAYLLGFPMPAALSLANQSDGWVVNDVPGWTLEGSSAALTFRFIGPTGRSAVCTVPGRQVDREEGGGGTTFEAGDARRMLFDLSTLEGLPPPGTYQLVVETTVHDQLVRSKPARLVLGKPSQADAAALGRLKPTGTWAEFLTDRRAVRAERLSATADHQTRLHLMLQRATYAEAPLAEQPLRWAEGLEGTLLEPEAQLVRLQLLVARHDASAADLAQRSGSAGPWPAPSGRGGRARGG